MFLYFHVAGIDATVRNNADDDFDDDDYEALDGEKEDLTDGKFQETSNKSCSVSYIPKIIIFIIQSIKRLKYPDFTS